ncbi:MbcA/ParS/Xre antitoxin family protein [Deinococcus roseus]|uniref:Antitoxin Xre/MbcA/ParS-like toxin-binding domain-containing protein n=1 Tax=Deinococcus roseus TaxID=392414 RepID=A0ABQ2D2X7_9DEIO|nr:MbcA/ParS/Xre antitoxin family protein [Deinococcus roseus]GGJ38614.1 hypothetical protein GCM10008938_25900 [Deinococcus roseus]
MTDLKILLERLESLMSCETQILSVDQIHALFEVVKSHPDHATEEAVSHPVTCQVYFQQFAKGTGLDVQGFSDLTGLAPHEPGSLHTVRCLLDFLDVHQQARALLGDQATRWLSRRSRQLGNRNPLRLIRQGDTQRVKDLLGSLSS